MKLKPTLYFCALFVHFFCYSQITDYAVSAIPDSLKLGANAVVRYCKQEIDIHDEKSMTVTFSKIITVLNKEGDAHVDAYQHYSKDSKIKKISAVLYNSKGMEILKYKKKDFHDVSAANGFYSDDRVKFLDFTPRGYPYTLKFEYTFFDKTTAFIPMWNPIGGYNLSVESKEIIVTNKNGLKIHLKENGFDMFPIQNLSQSNTIHFKIENKTAVKKEKYSPNVQAIFPNLKIYLEKFTLKGYESDLVKDWNSFGSWLRKNLYESQLELSDETKIKIKKLVKNESDPFKKAKLVYEYMQNKTRYVYVGIGVGGWQPTNSLDVDRLGYGDCKGLSNYTKAMLDVVGVESNWVIVYAKNKKNFDSEYHGLQGNHMILNLPKLDDGKDVWLECTSQTIPFGFLGDFTDDRDVLVLEKQGGVIKHTPKYKEENNQQITTGVVAIDSQGNVKAEVALNFTGLQYDDEYRKERLTPKELQKYYKSNRWSYIDNLKVTDHHFTNHKEDLSFVEDLKVEVDDYASLLGDEMLVKINIFHKGGSKGARVKERKNDVYIRNGYLDTDDIEVKIPEGYNFDQANIYKSIDTKFGKYSVSVSKDENGKVKYKRTFLIKEGLYPKEEYKNFSKFINQVNKNDNLKIVFNKK